MIRKPLFAATALALTFAAPAPFAAENNYVPTRTILQQTDVPGGNYTAILALTDIAPGMGAARHTHPGVEISYVLAGGRDFILEGQGKMHGQARGNFRLECGGNRRVQNGAGPPKVQGVYTSPQS